MDLWLPEETALLVIDMQNDFCHEKGAMASEGLSLRMINEMVPNLANLVENFRNKDGLRIFVKAVYGKAGSPYLSNITLQRAKRNFKKLYWEIPVCPEDGWGGEFFSMIPEPRSGSKEIIVKKHRYSAFYQTNLELILKNANIKRLILTGVATNVCVESTARDAFFRDFEVVVVSDATAAYFEDEQTASLTNIQRYFGLTMSSQDVLSNFK